MIQRILIGHRPDAEGNGSETRIGAQLVMTAVGKVTLRENAVKDGEALGLLVVIGTVAVVAAVPDRLVTVDHGIGILETLAAMILMTATRKEDGDEDVIVLLAARMIVVTVTGKAVKIEAKVAGIETRTLILVIAVPSKVAVVAEIKAAAIDAIETGEKTKRTNPVNGEEAEADARIAARNPEMLKAWRTKMFAALNRASIFKMKKLKSRPMSTRKLMDSKPISFLVTRATRNLSKMSRSSKLTTSKTCQMSNSSRKTQALRSLCRSVIK